MSIIVSESLKVSVEEVRKGEWSIQLITPGMGSSGYYPATVLEAAGAANIFPKGTHMYLDHPTESEEMERPERSVRDLTGILSEDSFWNGRGLASNARIFGDYKDTLAEMAAADAIGLSIRAGAVVESGEVEGQRVPIIKELTEGYSVDFVTHAGRGGKVLQVLEARRPSIVVYNSDRRVTVPIIDEATYNDRRDQLENQIMSRFGSTDPNQPSYVFVRDFDESNVWYTHEGQGIFQVGYTMDNDSVSLSGDPIAVRAQTTYVPLTEGNDSDSSTEDSGEDQVTEESTVEAEEIQRQLDAANEQLAQFRARDAARPVIETALKDLAHLPAPSAQRVTESVLAGQLPLTESGTLDAEKLAAEVKRQGDAEAEYVAKLRETSAPASSPVQGLGSGTVSESGVDSKKIEEDLSEAFSKLFDLDEKRAKIAAGGRN